jgi:hypothetical protein
MSRLDKYGNLTYLASTTPPPDEKRCAVLTRYPSLTTKYSRCRLPAIKVIDGVQRCFVHKTWTMEKIRRMEEENRVPKENPKRN